MHAQTESQPIRVKLHDQLSNIYWDKERQRKERKKKFVRESEKSYLKHDTLIAKRGERIKLFPFLFLSLSFSINLLSVSFFSSVLQVVIRRTNSTIRFSYFFSYKLPCSAVGKDIKKCLRLFVPFKIFKSKTWNECMSPSFLTAILRLASKLSTKTFRLFFFGESRLHMKENISKVKAICFCRKERKKFENKRKKREREIA